MKSQGRKVFVGLSGGVDSSVSAALLKKDGYDVTGVFIKVWHGDADLRGKKRGFTLMTETNCCQAAEDRLDAMRVCAKLNIPFHELNLEKEYKKEVVDYMIREYKAGNTPNPDVFCNRFIKFGAFYKWAMKNGADFVATGHYARVASDATREARNPKSEIRNKSQIQNPKLQTTNYKLLTGFDDNKDQSYFLWQIRREQLPYILFPVGGMLKSEVRKLAKKFCLPTADKKDSQGLCFVGTVDMKEFLKHFIRERNGNVLNESGEVIGTHDGAAFYTIGERFGFSKRLHLKSPEGLCLSAAKPTYVVAKDIRRNILTVSHKSPCGELPNARTEVTVTNFNWLVPPMSGRWYHARIRHRQPLQKAILMIPRRTASCLRGGQGSGLKIFFAAPQTAAPGQSLVLYDGAILMGGGVIS